MTSRRDCLKFTALTGLAAAGLLPARLVYALEKAALITRAIPKSGEKLPIVGLGSSATFREDAEAEDTDALTAVFKAMLEYHGTVFDTAPGYGASEEVAGRIVQGLGAEEKIFWATKLNVAGRGGGGADPVAARAQVEQSFDYIGKDPIDLIQVHNLADIPTQLGLLKEYKEEGRVRYIGTTCTNPSEYPRLIEVMRAEPLDFIGVDYAVDNRTAAETILPLAAERGIGVLVYVPFGRTRLFRRVGDRPLPDWVGDLGINSWAQFFLKFAAAHPAVTAVTPATSDAEHMIDNMAAAYGDLPDEALQKRMAEYVDQLPSA
ncbi:MAG TPA: aldo/keto reductase [Woeseiaceae bacterium]|nr:aldo/keto reductase [Woeseiaceae bacterium]